MQNYAKPHSGGLIIEIDEHKWRGREERLSGAYYYSQPDYAKDAINAKTPQAVMKIIGCRHGSKEVRGAMEYIARIDAPEKGEELELETQDGELIKGKEAIAALVKEWKADFEKSPISTYIKGENAEQIKKLQRARHATHILLSADCEPNEINYSKLEFAVRELLQREFNDKGYDYVFVAHQDTQHPHAHVVVRNKQRELGQEKRRKLKFNRNDLVHLRRQFAQELERNGIEQIATRSVDDPERCVKALQERIDGARKNLTWYQDRMKQPEWNKESTVDLQLYAANLQRELTRIRQLALESKIPLKEKQELEKEYKRLLDELGKLRKGKEADLALQSVERFRAKADALLKDAPKREARAAIARSDGKEIALSEAQETSAAQSEAKETLIAQAKTKENILTETIDAKPSIDKSTNLEQKKVLLPFEPQFVKLQERIKSAGALERTARMAEYRRIQRLIKSTEKEIRKERNYETRKALFTRLGQTRREHRALRREPKPPQRALNEYGLDLNFDHASAVKIGEARTAREQVKEANAGIVVIERQIKDAERVIKDLEASKIGGKEKREHLKSLNTIKERFINGYSKHIKDAAKLIDSAIAADKTLKAMPPSVKRKERELLHKTMESYAATLDKSAQFARQMPLLARTAAQSEIRRQRGKIERSFEMGLGR